MQILIIQNHKNYNMPHGSHLQKTAKDTKIEIVDTFPSDNYVISRWKGGLKCCDKIP